MSHYFLALLSAIALSTASLFTACQSSETADTLDIAALETSTKVTLSLDAAADLFDAIDKQVVESMDAEHLPGVAVVIVKEGQTIFKKGYGFANQLEGIPVDPDATLFRIGSITKPLTALGIMALVERGELSLEDEVSDHISDLGVNLGRIATPEGAYEPVRIKHLITHTSGFDQVGVGRYDPDFAKDVDQRRSERPTLGEYLADNNLRRTTAPGSHYRYDTYGITLAGHVIEQVTGLPYAEAMDQLLFSPAGMDKSSVGVDPATREALAVGHGWLGDGFGLAGYEVYFTQPASSIDATPADMGRLLEALTGGGTTADGNRLFEAATVKTILGGQYRPHPDFPGMSHGFVDEGGFATLDGYFPREVGHGGSMFGFQSSLTVFPEHDVALFVTTNRNPETGGGRVNLNGDIFRLVRAAIAGVPEQTNFAVPDPDPTIDLSEYAGSYYYDVFCSTCSEAELEQGAWRRGNPVDIRAISGGLVIRDLTYRPTGEKDLFVSENGARRVFFKRDQMGRVQSYSWNSSPDAFARYPDETDL